MDDLEPLPDWDFDAGDEFDRIIDAQDKWGEWTPEQELRFWDWKLANPLRDLDSMTREEARWILGEEVDA